MPPLNLDADPAAPVISDAHEEVQRRVAEHAIPLRTVEAGNGFEDMEPLRAVVGDARVVALGEATHGTREFFQLKHRMLEFLVTQMGFTVFAIEATMPEAFDLNEYVLHGTGDPKQLLAALYFWTWDTEEVLAMIEWMRAYNADPAHPDKVKFYGFDMQSAPRALAVVVDYLERVDPSQARKTARALALLFDAFAINRLADWTSTERRRVQNGAQALSRRFEARRSDYVSRSSSSEYDLAAQHLRIVAQFVETRVRFGTRIPWATGRARDLAMAENVEWILAHEPGKKLVIWAHNLHVATAGDFPMGTELRRGLGSTMVVFGFAFYRGGFRAVDFTSPSGKLRDFAVAAAGPSTLDALLASTRMPVLALDLRMLPTRGPAASWFDAPHATRSIGAVYSRAHADYEHQEITKQRYDALLFVDRTTPARGTRMDQRPAEKLLAAPTNLGFEAAGEGGIPFGWEVQPGFEIFDVAVESSDQDPAEGRRYATLRKLRAGHPPLAVYEKLSQALDATSYRDKRVRLRAWVRADVHGPRERAYLWLRVRRPQNTLVYASGIAARAIESRTWTREELDITVPHEALSLSYGLALVGEGEASIDGVEITVVSR